MGWLSSAWGGIKDALGGAKDAVGDAWSGAQNAVRDITGVDSLNTLFATGGLAMVPANLSGKGILGEALTNTLAPLTAVPNQGLMGQQMTGPLMGNAPANLTMGTGAQPAPQGQSAPNDLASLFGQTGYQYGPSQTSTALLQSNPGAYQYQPLMNGTA